MRPWAATGVTRGTPATGPVRAPRPMVPVKAEAFRSTEKESSSGEPVDELALEAWTAYAEGVGTTVAAAQREGERHLGWAQVRKAVYRLRQGGVRPRVFIRFVVRRVGALRRRRPFFPEVFGDRAVTGWLAVYLREGANASGSFHYVMPADRRARYTLLFLEDMGGPLADVLVRR